MRTPRLYHDFLQHQLATFSDCCRTLEFFPPVNGYALVNHVVKNISLERDDACQIACYLKNECLSYNFGRLKDRSFICQLSDSDSNQHPQDLQWRQGFIFQGTKVRCFMISEYIFISAVVFLMSAYTVNFPSVAIVSCIAHF